MDATQATAVNGILLATMAGALVVLAGALYAAVFAIGKLFDNPALVKLSYLFYAVLVVAVLVLDRTLGFSGAWQLLVVVMLAGYLFAPQIIWHLCVATHQGEADTDVQLVHGNTTVTSASTGTTTADSARSDI